MWEWVARWIKREANVKSVMQSAEAVRDHWYELAADIGLDPQRNVIIAESETEVRVGLSEQLATEYREGPGEWRYY